MEVSCADPNCRQANVPCLSGNLHLGIIPPLVWACIISPLSRTVAESIRQGSGSLARSMCGLQPPVGATLAVLGGRIHGPLLERLDRAPVASRRCWVVQVALRAAPRLLPWAQPTRQRCSNLQVAVRTVSGSGWGSGALPCRRHRGARAFGCPIPGASVSLCAVRSPSGQRHDGSAMRWQHTRAWAPGSRSRQASVLRDRPGSDKRVQLNLGAQRKARSDASPARVVRACTGTDKSEHVSA
jgi:hypothetical protein